MVAESEGVVVDKEALVVDKKAEKVNHRKPDTFVDYPDRREQVAPPSAALGTRGKSQMGSVKPRLPPCFFTLVPEK